MQTDLLSSGQEQLETSQLITQLTQKIEKLSPAEREAVSAELQALKSCIESLTPTAYVPLFDNEAELRQSEARYRSLFEQMSEGFALHEMIFDEGGRPVDYRFLEVNPAFERLTGLHRVDVIGRLMTEVLPGDTSNWINIYGAVAQTGESIRFENYSIALRQHYEVFAYRPAPGQFATLFVNTTERKLVEFEAQEGKRLLDVIMEYVPEGITIADSPHAHIRMVSRYGLDKLGGDHSNLTLEEVSSRWKAYQVDGDRPMDLEEQPLMRAIQGGETVRNMEMVVTNSSGEKLSLLCNAAPIISDNGEITGGIVAWHDITERRRDLEVLREREAMLQGLFEAESIFAAITELTEDDIIFVRANTKLANFYGRTVEEMAGTTHRKLGYDEDSMKYWLGEYRRCMADQRPIHMEFPLTVAGVTRWYYCTQSPIEAGPSGNPRFSFVTIDITENKKVEEALRLSEERFRLASQAVQGIVYDWDIVNSTVFRSAGTEQVLGFRPEEMPAGNSWWQDRIHPEDRESQLRFLQAVFSGKDETYQTEYRVLHKNGHWVHILDRSFIIRNADGKPLRMIGSSNDISDRKNYEKTLLESQRREQAKVQELEALLESTPAFVWISHDQESRMMTGNRAAYESVRMQPGTNISKSAPPAERPTHFIAMKDGKEIPTDELPVQMAAAKGVPVRDYEFDFVFDNGEVMSVMGNAHPLFDEQGRPRGAVSAFLDITERKRIENALRESEAYFALSLANTSIFLFNQDRELRYTWRHNPVPLFEDKTIGKTDFDFYNLEEAGLLTGIKRKVIETGQRVRQEVTLHIDSDVRIFDLILGPLKNENGDIIGLTGAASDITQMRRLEQQQTEHETQAEVQRRLQEYRERERREIARDIHDGPIQTLMSALINIQLTKEMIDNTAIQLDLESISATVRSAVHELRDVVNQLRPPALIRFGVTRSISLHAEDYHDKHPNCTINLDLPSAEIQMPEDVILTLFRIYQEAMNNVARHAKARQVWVRYRVENQKAILEVQDNGAGFRVPSDLLHQTQMGHYGLAGMKERAEIVGGAFSVLSEPGEGTLIQAVVPLDRA